MRGCDIYEDMNDELMTNWVEEVAGVELGVTFDSKRVAFWTFLVT